MAKSAFEQIKKQNGERFAKAIRNYDNGIFDIPKIVDVVKYAGHDAEPILHCLESLKDIRIEESAHPKDPFVLLNRAGYRAYYVHNLREQNAIAKYFEEDELLCTFYDPYRFQKYHIINAVKKDVAKINRQDFIGKEKRDDRYGTSVISIQILTTGGFISIKNRYNHTVSNPDNTFDSNPDNIIKGLSASLKKYLNVDFSSQQLNLPPNFAYINGQLLRYNYEINNIYFGENFYAQDGQIYPMESHEIMMDSCILNVRDRTLYDPSNSACRFKIDEVTENTGSFMSVMAHELKGKKIQIQRNKETNYREVWADDTCLIKIQDGRIVELCLPTTTEIGNNFLWCNECLSELNIPNLKKVGVDFLESNKNLTSLDAPSLEVVGFNFLKNNKNLTRLDAPNLAVVEGDFLRNNECLTEITVPNLEFSGGSFLENNKSLKRLDAPSLQITGGGFLWSNECLTEINIPNLEFSGCAFLESNKSLKRLDAPSLQKVGDGFLATNECLSELNIPNLKEVGKDFLQRNLSLTKLDVPSLQKAGDGFLRRNECLSELNIPNLKEVGVNFLENNKNLTSLDAPNLEVVWGGFLKVNRVLNRLAVQKIDALMQYTLCQRCPHLSIIATNGSFDYFNRMLDGKPIQKVKSPTLRSRVRTMLNTLLHTR